MYLLPLPALPQTLVKKVTEDNETPAPGWALDQMARNTVTNPGCSDEIVDLVVKRLAKNSTDVKLKALRAVHFIARRGSVHFRRSMQRQTQIIRAHLSACPQQQNVAVAPAVSLPHGPAAAANCRRALVQTSGERRTRSTATLRGGSSATPRRPA